MVVNKKKMQLNLIRVLTGPFLMPMKNDFDKSFMFAIHDVARLTRWCFDRQSQGLDLTRAQWTVLAHLYRRDGIQQKTLAKIMEIAPISLTRQLDRLEENSWIERRDDPTDRRAKNIFLAPKAVPMIKKLSKLGQKVQETALRGIDAGDREKLLTTLAKIRQNLTDSS